MQPLHHAWKQTGVLRTKDCFILQYLTISIKFTKYCTSGETVPVQHAREHPQHSTAHYPVCLNLGEQRAPGELPMPEETLESVWPLPHSPSCSSSAQMLPAETQDLPERGCRPEIIPAWKQEQGVPMHQHKHPL